MSISMVIQIVVGVVAASLVWFLFRKEETKKVAIAIGAVALIYILFIANGGDTVTILNHSTEDICEVYFAFTPEENGWGPNRLNSPIRYTHSRDIRMPIYFEWFGESDAGFTGRVISCEGEELAVHPELGIETNYEVWEVR
jgi:hypothetical protein